jgi:hypothetical protein
LLNRCQALVDLAEQAGQVLDVHGQIFAVANIDHPFMQVAEEFGDFAQAFHGIAQFGAPPFTLRVLAARYAAENRQSRARRLGLLLNVLDPFLGFGKDLVHLAFQAFENRHLDGAFRPQFFLHLGDKRVNIVKVRLALIENGLGLARHLVGHGEAVLGGGELVHRLLGPVVVHAPGIADADNAAGDGKQAESDQCHSGDALQTIHGGFPQGTAGKPRI